jgi:hypothetical protein
MTVRLYAKFSNYFTVSQVLNAIDGLDEEIPARECVVWSHYTHPEPVCCRLAS